MIPLSKATAAESTAVSLNQAAWEPSQKHNVRALNAYTFKAKILIAAHDPALGNTIVEYMRSHHCTARAVSSIQDLIRAISNGEPNVIILGIQPDAPCGLELIEDIRACTHVPLLVVSDPTSDDADKVVVLELGADDVVTSPLNLREMLARVRAVLRRDEIARFHLIPQERGGFTFAGWRLDCRHRRLFNPEGVQVPLTKMEYALLLAFLHSAQRPLSRQQLVRATRMHEDVFDRSIDVKVLRLRRKLGENLSAPRFILTQRGFGYKFAVNVDIY